MSVTDAAQVLLKDWPGPACKSRLATIGACLAVVRGEKSPRVARRRSSLRPRRHLSRRTDLGLPRCRCQ
ncbi:DUF982 domain-containing protein [Mesorhizobium sp. M0984]